MVMNLLSKAVLCCVCDVDARYLCLGCVLLHLKRSPTTTVGSFISSGLTEVSGFPQESKTERKTTSYVAHTRESIRQIDC